MQNILSKQILVYTINSRCKQKNFCPFRRSLGVEWSFRKLQRQNKQKTGLAKVRKPYNDEMVTPARFERATF